MWLATGMSVPPLPDLDTLSLDELKKLVVQLLVRVSALKRRTSSCARENGRLKALPKKPKLAPGGMDKADASRTSVRDTKQARRQRRERRSGRRTPPMRTVTGCSTRTSAMTGSPGSPARP